MDDAPDVCVVVPTHNRAQLLPRLVSRLEAQKGVESFEVVIVDDASADDTPTVLRDLADRTSLRLRVLRHDENRGPMAARNAGWRSTSAPLIAFTDDDCMPDDHWLAGLLAGSERADIVQGRTEPDPDDPTPIGPFGHTIIIREELGHYETCNLAYRRTILEQLGGFDETFFEPSRGRPRAPAWGDDIDFGWRARKAGAQVTFVPEALVYHEIRPSNFGAYMRDATRREALVLSLKRYPEMRDYYYRRYWLNAAHPPAIATAVAFIALVGRPRSPLRWALAVGAAAIYARACMATRHAPARRRDWLRDLPLAFIADLFEIALFTRGSVRHRTFFL